MLLTAAKQFFGTVQAVRTALSARVVNQ